MGCLYLHDMSRLTIPGAREKLEERFKRYYMGIRGREIEPIHVMDGLRYLEKIDGEYVSYLDAKYGLLTRFMKAVHEAGIAVEEESPRQLLSAIKNYDLLSEISHPNGLGTQFLYPDSDNEGPTVERARLRFRHAALMAIWQSHHLLNSLRESADLPDRFRAAFLS